jgi:hypothetical protein
MNSIFGRIIFVFIVTCPCILHALTGEAITGYVAIDTRVDIITSNMADQQIGFRKLMVKYAVTTDFGAKTFSARGLPPGLSINKNTGVISGKPRKKGTYTVTITAQKKKGNKIIKKATAIKVFKVV